MDLIEVGEKHAGGRPSKFTPEVQAKLLEAIGEGATYSLACKYAGVDYTTFARWMLAGSDGDGEFRTFYDMVRTAEAEMGVAALKAWRGHFDSDYRAPRDFMERRFRDDGFGRQIDVNHSGQVRHEHERVLITTASGEAMARLQGMMTALLPLPADDGEPVEGEFAEVEQPAQGQGR